MRPQTWNARARHTSGDRNAPRAWSDRYRFATLIQVSDRHGKARLDEGRLVVVIIPNGLWPTTGQRVALTLYPDGWVVAGLVRGGNRA